MNPRTIASLTLVATLVGCGDDSPQDSASESGIQITLTTTTMDPDSDSATESTTQGTDGTSGASETETATETASEPECIDKSDCQAQFQCVLGKCEFDPSDCGGEPISAEITTPNVVLVLDKSGSMVNAKWDHDADPDTPVVTRWFSLVKVVEFIVTQFNNSMNMGMVLYPSLDAKAQYNSLACLVESEPEVPVQPMAEQELLMALPPVDSTAILGGTPTRLGMDTAVNHLLGLEDGKEKYIILVTDGAANCAPEHTEPFDLIERYDHALPQFVEDAHGAGIQTFVVGIDMANEVISVGGATNSEKINPYEELNKVAIAGGVPKNDPDNPDERFYQSLNQIELQMALEEIAMQLLSCDITLTTAPVYPDYVEVKVNGELLEQVKDCDTETGWQYIDDSHSSIRFCGIACADFQSTGEASVQYVCPAPP